MKKKVSKILVRIIAIYAVFYALSFVNHLFHIGGQDTNFIFSEDKNIELTLALFFAIISIVQAFAFWTQKKWSLFLYLFSVVVFHLYSIFMDRWNPIMVLAPIIIISIVLINYKNLE